MEYLYKYDVFEFVVEVWDYGFVLCEILKDF